MSSARLYLIAAASAIAVSRPVVARSAATTRTESTRAPTPAATRHEWAHVTYLSGETIYLDAGTTAGLREKSTADLMRGDSVIAVVEVQFVSSTRAAARATRGGDRIVVGDSVRFVPVAEQKTMAAQATPSSGGSSDSSSNASAKRKGPKTVTARIGFRYLNLETGSGANGKLTQPALDVRVEGHRIDGTSLGLVIDARAHRQRSGDGRVDGSTRFYQSLIEFQGAGTLPVRIAAGRQLSNVLSPIGFFDGITLDADHAHWRVGALAGTQPDYTTFMPSGAIREAGAWLQWHNAPGRGSMLQATLGGVGSYTGGGTNREFALLSTIYVTPIVSVYATQEVDLNRGWKRVAESGHMFTPTSTFATMRVSLTHDFSVNGGYDSRRSVRLYRDFLTPDVVFDDALRRGYWGGLSYSIRHLYASVDSRMSDGATVGSNQSTTASVSLTRFTSLGFGIRARGTSYRGPTVTGELTSASLEANPKGRVRIEATVGQRADQHAANGFGPVHTSWVGLDADAGIGRSWYLMLSSYREVGSGDRLLQQYAGLSWRY